MKVFTSLLFGFLVPTIQFCSCVHAATNHSNVVKQCNVTVTVFPGKPAEIINKDVTIPENFSVSYNNPNAALDIKRGKQKNLSVTVFTELGDTIQLIIRTNDTCKLYVTIKVSTSCPFGYLYNSLVKMCTCNDVQNVIKCNSLAFTFEVLVGYCVGSEDTTDSNQSLLVVARCPFTDLRNYIYSTYQSNDSNVSAAFCNQLHRKNALCRECISNHGISVYSDIFQCIECTFTYPLKNLFTYLSIEIIPTSIFFLVILYFHIRITSGPANGFIFFAQMMVTPFEATFLRYLLNWFFFSLDNDDDYVAKGMYQSVIIPYSVWNLDFYRIIGKDICLSQALGPIDVLVLRYISILYPLFLLVLSYIIIELQAMNFRPVLWMLKILCFPCMRWRRVWKAKISILDAFATYVLLSYTKLMYTSFSLISQTEVYGSRAKTIVSRFDPKIDISSSQYTHYVALSIVMMLLFGLFPPILLTFYQFKSCLSCLERLGLRRPGLEQFVLAFQGCYKDGENGTADRRFFAGLYFVFRFLMVLFYTIPSDTRVTLGFKVFACTLFLLVCGTLQPYKKTKYTVFDCLFFALLATIAVIQFYIYTDIQITEELSHDTFLNFFLLYIPLLYITCYVAHWLFVCIKNRESNPYLLLINNDDNELRDTPPIEGREGCCGRPVNINISPRPSITHTEVSIATLSHHDSSDNENPIRGENEVTPLLPKKREMRIISQHAATLSQDDNY